MDEAEKDAIVINSLQKDAIVILALYEYENENSRSASLKILDGILVVLKYYMLDGEYEAWYETIKDAVESIRHEMESDDQCDPE